MTIVGQRKVYIQLTMCDYIGELDQNGEACGAGIATEPDNPSRKYEATFMDNKIHGICNI